MVPAQLETHPDDAEFDLDLRLQAVTRDVSDDAAEKPPSVDKECGTQYTCCIGTCN